MKHEDSKIKSNIFSDDGNSIHLKDKHGNEIQMDENGITLRSSKKIMIVSDDITTIKGSQLELNP